ncbi:MAG: phytanoyl-CoA dioxygenase family protein [Steroidobacteraceae bacterium]
MKILSNIERCDESWIIGWVTIADQPDEKLVVDILLDGQSIGQCAANEYREDLQAAGHGNGYCAFSFQTPAFVPKSEVERLTFRLGDSNVFLFNPLSPAKPLDEPTPRTRSRFGGLWIDRDDWIDNLASKHRQGLISDELSVEIFKFVRDGYLVIKKAVPPTLIDEVNQQIDAFWRFPPVGLKIETFEPDGNLRLLPPDVSLRQGRTKMLDAFAYSAAIRQAIAAPKVMEFLSALFEDKPKAFQSLTFWNGSQQAMHKDSAYVKVDSSPMHMAATWLALEDVSPGSGELEYYIGSHRAPDYLFGGVYKWMDNHVQEHDAFLSSLHADAETHGHVKGTFRANKGDVLIWHADLAHGGSPITAPGATRRSLVTHFTGASDEPFYRRYSSYSQLESGTCWYVSQFADIQVAKVL